MVTVLRVGLSSSSLATTMVDYQFSCIISTLAYCCVYCDTIERVLALSFVFISKSSKILWGSVTLIGFAQAGIRAHPLTGSHAPL